MTHRKSIFSLFAALMATLLFGCAENVEKLAQPYLDRAEQSFVSQQYSLAKLQLDSIKELFPTAFEARKKAQTMMLHVDLNESQRALHYLDSLYVLSQSIAQPLIPKFYFDKDPAYQEIGHYYDRKYYYDNIDAFREYQSHMGEPNFDWDFYSDWHKDMYGFRPH